VTMGDADSRDKICTDTHEYGEVTVRALLTKDALHAADVKKVHLSNLATHISQDAIRDAFSQFGAVLDVHTPKKTLLWRAPKLWLRDVWLRRVL